MTWALPLDIPKSPLWVPTSDVITPEIAISELAYFELEQYKRDPDAGVSRDKLERFLSEVITLAKTLIPETQDLSTPKFDREGEAYYSVSKIDQVEEALDKKHGSCRVMNKVASAILTQAGVPNLLYYSTSNRHALTLVPISESEVFVLEPHLESDLPVEYVTISQPGLTRTEDCYHIPSSTLTDLKTLGFPNICGAVFTRADESTASVPIDATISMHPIGISDNSYTMPFSIDQGKQPIDRWIIATPEIGFSVYDAIGRAFRQVS